MMKLLLTKNHGIFTQLQILFFGIMGIVLFTVPTFVLSGAFYAVSLYLIFTGIFNIVSFTHNKNKKGILDYVSISVSLFLLVFGICSLFFARYLVNVAPLYLGGLFLLESVYCIAFAFRSSRELQRLILVTLGITVFLGGIAVLVFTFGFGIDGLSGLANISGASAVLVCVYRLTNYLFRKEKKHSRSEGMA